MRFKPPVLASIAIIAAMLALSAWAAPRSPPLMAVHWGVAGTADGWAPKEMALLIMPGMACALTLLFAVLPALMPQNGRLERSASAYGAIWVGVVALLGLVHVAMVLQALKLGPQPVRLVSIGVGALLAAVGNYLPKVRYNYVLGVRTPWTLTSERVWDQTHRFAGLLFVGVGVVIVVSTMLVADVAHLAEVICIAAIGAAFSSVLYSYLAARRLAT